MQKFLESQAKMKNAFSDIHKMKNISSKYGPREIKKICTKK